MQETIRTLPRIRQRQGLKEPPRVPDYEQRIAALQQRYTVLGLVNSNMLSAKQNGHRRAVRIDGVLHPSVSHAARAIGMTDASLHRALRLGIRCRGHVVEWENPL